MTREIPLTQGKVALVDDEDYDWLMQWKWHAFWSGFHFYAARKAPAPERSRMIYMHRQITGAGKGEDVDHRDSDGLNNQRCNLRRCTHAENMRNRGAQSNNRSGLKGVSFYNKTKKWRARIRVDGRQRTIGYYATPELAHAAYCAAARSLHGEFARTEQ